MRRLVWLALLLASPAWAASQPAFLDVTLQGHLVDKAVQFDRDGTTLMAPADTWTHLGVLLRPGETGDLSTTTLGLTCSIDDLTQAATCTGPADRFPIQQAGTKHRTQAPLSPSASGLLLGYDFAVAYSPSGTAWSTSPDARIITPWGQLESTGQYNHTSSGSVWRRGFTTFTKDWADKRLVLQAGDITPNAIASISPTMMGGVRFGSDPSLDPLDPTYPIPTIGGVAVADSKIDAYLNARPIGQVGEVGRGGFSLANPQAAPGANTMDLVLTDPFGRQTTISDSFYISPTLLRSGLSRWDVNLGLTRQGNGDTYRTPAATASYERGLNDHWTIQGGAQASTGHHNVAGGFTVGGRLGTADLTLGTSSGGGTYFSSDYSYNTSRWSFGVGHSQASNAWWDLSQGNGYPVAKSQTSVHASYQINPHLSVGLTGARVSDRDGTTRTRTDLRLSGSAHSVNWSLDFEKQSGLGNALMAFVSIPLGRNVQASIQRDDQSIQANVNGSWDGSTSGNWSATANHRNGSTQTLEHIMVRTPLIQNDTSVSTGPGGTGVSDVVSGALWVGSGGIHSAPPVFDGFAVVEVGVPNVRVYLENRLVGRTGKNGSLLITPLTSLVPNSIRIATEDLPLGVDVAKPTMVGVPDRHGGALVIFPTSGGLAREFRVVNDAGDNVPAQTQVGDTIIGDGGVLYLEKAQAGASLLLTPPTGKPCQITIPKPLPAFADIATLTCTAQHH
jgi:outer membrane usher protein FimD/PapC